MLKPWIRICDPVQWKKAILQDIASGPEGNRAVTGALMRDLEALRDHEVRKLLDE